MKEAKHPFKYTSDNSSLAGETIKNCFIVSDELIIVTDDMKIFKFEINEYECIFEIDQSSTNYNDIITKLFHFVDAEIISRDEAESIMEEHKIISKEKMKQIIQEETERRRKQYPALKAEFEPEGKPCHE